MLFLMEIALSENRVSQWEDLLDELQPRQLTVLQAFYKICPWGDRRADLREATMASVVAHALHSFAGGRGEPIDPNKLKDYLAKPDDSRDAVSPEAAAATMRHVFPTRSR